MVSEVINCGVIVVLLRIEIALSGDLGLDVADSLGPCLRDALVHAAHSGVRFDASQGQTK